ncbi:MAG: N-acetylmuramoyl-L-alanine amidase [Clostridiaceae bacterium]|nr:N-acetylmuramoyl-L-alanine amidase [Clostridiaceae bacterium]
MRVVFDIGHGSDTWPPSKGVWLPDGSGFAEHDFNSAVAIKARELAEKQGFEVLFTQQPYSPEVKLGPRCNWVNEEHKKKPILCLVSFHANASSNVKAAGWGVFHWHNSTKGKKLAELWAKYARNMLPIGVWGTGIWQCVPGTWSNFDIVRKPVMPCILIEHFFFTNFDELKKCNTPEMIDLFAQVTVKALCEYAGIEYKEEVKEEPKEEPKEDSKDLIEEYKRIIQERCRFSNPQGVWDVIEKHHPYAEALLMQWARSYNDSPR